MIFDDKLDITLGVFVLALDANFWHISSIHSDAKLGFGSHFLRSNNKPGSAVLTETSLPCPSRVVPNRSLTLPITWSCSSRTRVSNDPSKPVVTDPISLFFPSRTYAFFSNSFPSTRSIQTRFRNRLVSGQVFRFFKKMRAILVDFPRCFVY